MTARLLFEYDGKGGDFREKLSGVSATVTSAPFFVNRNKGKALSMDGSDDVISWTTANVPLLDLIADGDFSMEVWCKINSGADASIVSKGGPAADVSNVGFEILARSGNRIDFATSDGTTQKILAYNSTLPFDGNFHHLIFTFDADGNMETIVDLDNSTSDTHTVTLTKNNSELMQISGRYNDFPGEIMLVRMYDSVLTTKEKNKLFENFEESMLTIDTKRNFNYPSATDSSGEINIAAAYNMIPTGGKIRDISDNNHTGTITDCLGTKGIRERALSFNGTSSEVNFTSNNPIGTADDGFTIMCWLKRTGATTSRQIVFGTNVQLRNSICYVRESDSTFKSITFTGDLPSVGDWFHLAQTYSNGTMRLYINGVNTTNSPLTGIVTPILDMTTFIIGSNGSGEYLPGDLDSLEMYSRALTEDEVKTHYNKNARIILFKDDFKYGGADSIAKLPNDWTPGTGAFKIDEDSTGKFLECTSNGTVSVAVDLNDAIGDGYIKTLTGDLSSDSGDTVSNATNVAYANGLLTFTLTTGQKIYDIVIQRGVEV